jgi:hypothetical protein
VPNLAEVVNDNASANKVCIEGSPSSRNRFDKQLSGLANELNMLPQWTGRVQFK